MRTPPRRRISARHQLTTCKAAFAYQRSNLSRHLHRILRRLRMPAKIQVNKPLPSAKEKDCASTVSIVDYLYHTPAHSSYSSDSEKKRPVSPSELDRRGSHRVRSNLMRKKAQRIPQRHGSSVKLAQQPCTITTQQSTTQPTTNRQFSFEPSPKFEPPSKQFSDSRTVGDPQTQSSQSIPPYPVLPSQLQPPILPSHPHQPEQSSFHLYQLQPPSPKSQESLADLAAFVNLRLLQSLLQPAQGQSQPSSSARHVALRAFYIHILRRTNVTPTHILLALKYVQRLCAVATGLTASRPESHPFASNLPAGMKLTPRAILLVSLVLAGKYLDDVKRYANSAWAEVGGMSVADINAAERECLSALSWNLVVTSGEFNDWLRELDALVRSVNAQMQASSASSSALETPARAQDTA